MNTVIKNYFHCAVKSITDGTITLVDRTTNTDIVVEDATLLSFENGVVILEQPDDFPYNYKPKDGEIVFIEGCCIDVLCRYCELTENGIQVYSYLLSSDLILSPTSAWADFSREAIIKPATSTQIAFYKEKERAKGVKWDNNTNSYKKIFTKDMLKPGMVIEYRDGRKRLVVPKPEDKGLYLMGYNSVQDLIYYTDTLEYDSDKLHDLTIAKVYELTQMANFQNLNDSNYIKEIWSRD